jgi:hypothetical protein
VAIVEGFQGVDLLGKPVAKAWVVLLDRTLLSSFEPCRVDIVLVVSGYFETFVERLFSS